MFKNPFKLDLRSLALARIMLGILAFFDIGRRIDDIDAFFSDGGLLTRADLIQNFELNWRMTLLNLNGSPKFALGIALIGMLAAITFTLGWRTRLSNFIIWIVTISFQARFPEAATSGGDMLIRIFYFWSLFLPMNAVYSMDAAVNEKKVTDYQYFSVFSATWVMQIFLLYFFTFLFKWAPVYHTDFDAVWFMLQLDIFTTPIGKWLGQQYLLTKILSAACYALEIIGPLMLLIPWRRDAVRGLAVLAFWGFHLGIGLTLHLGNFVPICLIIWMGIIPTTWWNYLAVKFKSTSEKTITLFYDSESIFARQLANLAKVFLFLDVEIVPSRKGNMEHTYVLEDQELRLVTGQPVVINLLLSSRLRPIRSIGKILLSDLNVSLSEVKEAGAINPSRSDMSSSKTVTNALKSTFDVVGFENVRMKPNKFERFLGSFLLTLVIAWNIEGYIKERNWYIGSPLDEIMFTLNLNQGWAMFAPHPQRNDGWWVMDGNLGNGDKWDALNNKEVTFERPENIYATYGSEDWRKFLDNLKATRDDKYLLALSRYICRTWNSKHSGDKSLQTFKLHFMQEWADGPKVPPKEVQKLTLWNHSCF